MKEKRIEDILTIEWNMFVNVPDDGSSLCKKDHVTFRIMRSSQFKAWPEDLLDSYFCDLVDALSAQRNLMTEKYARMAGQARYLDAEGGISSLPDVSPEIRDDVDQISAVYLAWHEELSRAYPRLSALGRPLRAAQDTADFISAETYLRAELLTYSAGTLCLLRDYTLHQQQIGENIPLRILQNTVAHYGYASLQDAESRL
jgi:hypothetical protein